MYLSKKKEPRKKNSSHDDNKRIKYCVTFRYVIFFVQLKNSFGKTHKVIFFFSPLYYVNVLSRVTTPAKLIVLISNTWCKTWEFAAERNVFFSPMHPERCKFFLVACFLCSVKFSCANTRIIFLCEITKFLWNMRLRI